MSNALAPTGALHADLMGGMAQYRFRLQRFAVDELQCALACTFEYEGKVVAPLSVLDVSPTGLGLSPQDELTLVPGTTLQNLEMRYGDEVVYSGTGTVVYQIDRPHRRLGLRFTTELFDLQGLWLNDRFVQLRLERDIVQMDRYQEHLPEAWRSAVGDLRQCLQKVKDLLEDAERSVREGEWWRRARDERPLIKRVYERWGPRYHEQIRTLDHLSAELLPDTVELARGYATRMLMPLLSPGPMHHRCYHKPQGYAGDYRLMTMYFAQELQGGSWWARFLHYTAQNYSLGHTVVARAQNMHDTVAATIKSGGSRICSLACGPAIEIERYLDDIKKLKAPVEFTLIDQDKEALEYCHTRLNEALLRRSDDALPVKLQPLHVSVRQLLKPQDDAEKALLADVLAGQDLIYSAGLLDYLPDKVARGLFHRLYTLLAPGGRMFIGNLRRVPDTAWMMENVLAWHLEYRTEATMMALVDALKPEPAEVRIETDATGHCIFLDVRRPG